MKILVAILAMFMWLSGFATKRYFSTTGNDLTGNGTLATPYASLGKACSVTLAGDTAFALPGTYTQSAIQVLLVAGGKIDGSGSGAGGSKIILTFTVAGSGGFNNAALQLSSASPDTLSVSSISNIWFDGNNFGCFSGILVRARSNVTIHDCKFTNFGITAVNFNGKTSQTTGTPPATFSKNNSVINCSFYECSDRITQQANSISAGSICLAGQRNILFQYDTLSNTTKPIGHNGNLFGAVQGNNIGAKWLNNIMVKPPDDGSSFNFGIESWYDQGGCIFAFNTYTGGGNVIDVGYGGANRGDSAYSWYVHHNLITNPTLLTSNPSQPVGSIFFQLEPSKNVSPGCPCSSIPLNATIGDARVEYNYLKNVGTLCQITLNNFAGNFCDKIYINHNVVESGGYANNTYSGIFNFTITLGTRIDSIFIDNNTLVSNTGAGSSKATLILQPDDGGAITDIYFRNNIATNALGYAYLIFRGANSCTRIFSQNNILFNNAFTNNYLVFGGTPGPTFFTNTGNFSGIDPKFISAVTPVNYNLQATSVGVNGGLNPPATYVGAYPPGTITPTISWTPASPITYGTALGAAQLNATSGGVPGTFAYTPALGAILNAGTQTLSVVFTPTDQTTYSVVSSTASLTVNKATATLTYSNLTQTYNGTPLSPTITTNPAGLTVLFTTYNGVGSTPINAGVYTVVSSLNNANYTASNITNTFTINKATATINLSNLNQIYDASPKPVTVSTTPNGLTGLTILYNGSATVPTAAGSYPIVVSLSNTNYTATNATGTLVIAKATPTVTWATPSPIVYGTTLSGSQLNASASVAGSFTYIPTFGTLLNAGTQVLTVNFTPTDAANYNSVNGTTVSIVVTKATATIALSNLNQTYDGTGKSATATTTPAGLNTITITYNGSTTLPIAAGSYAVNASLNNPNYTASAATGTLVIAQATATINVANLTQTYDGTQKSVSVTTAPAGLNTITVTYNGSGISPTNAGTYAVVVTLSNPNYAASPVNTTLTINKATPVISWANPVSITYGTALSGTQLNATSSVAGTFIYTPASGTILNAGSNILTVDFTPTNASNYNSVNGTTVNITVNQATAIITASNFNQSFDGNPKPITVSVSPNVGVITILYNGSPTAPSAVGSYPVLVTLSNTNYQATPVNGTLVISSSAAAVTITNTSQTYDGSPKPVTVTTNPPGLPCDVTYNGSSTVPTVVGTYAVVATINDGGIHTGTASATLTINKANPVVSWATPAAITYGTALSGTQLNASASVPGTFTYNPVSGTVLNAGTQILSVNFVPTDGANYNSINGTTVNLTVNKAVATLTLSNLNQPFDGTPKSVTVTSAPVGLTVIAVTYNGSNPPPSAVGSYAVVATLNNSNYTATPANGTLVISTTAAGISISNLNQVYTGGQINVTVTTNPSGITNTVTYNGSSTPPTNVGSYTVIATLSDGIHTGADTQTLVISKATPIITWANPANIVFGTALSGTQLNATVNAAGGLVYTPAAGAVLSVGTQSLSVSFTPSDPANYNSVIKVVSITVTGASATLTISNLAQTYNTSPHSVIVTTSPAGLSGVSVTYNGSPTPPTNAGSYAVVATLTNPNYTAPPANATLVIAKLNPVLSWTIPAPISVGTILSSTQLNATANVPGTFTYNPGSGTIPNPGTIVIVATFTPTDAVNYTSGLTISVPLSVIGAPFSNWFIDHGGIFFMNLPGQIFP